MFDCGQDERTFWKTMNPRRLHALFNARFRPQRNTEERRMNIGGKKTKYVDLDVPAGNGKSLMNYFNGK